MQKAPNFKVAVCLTFWALVDLLSSHSPVECAKSFAAYATATSMLENSALLWGSIKTSMTKPLCTMEQLTKQNYTNERVISIYLD